MTMENREPSHYLGNGYGDGYGDGYGYRFTEVAVEGMARGCEVAE